MKVSNQIEIYNSNQSLGEKSWNLKIFQYSLPGYNTEKSDYY